MLTLTLPAGLFILLIALGWARGTTGTMTLAGNSHGYIYPANAVDLWLTRPQPPAETDDWWVRNVFTASHHHAIPVPRDRPLEIAIVGHAVSINTTPWVESSITGGDLAPGAMTDERFILLALSDLERAIGPGWNTPTQQNIAWRIDTRHGLSGSVFYVGSANMFNWVFSVSRLEPKAPIDEPIVWLKPWFYHQSGRLSIRIGDLARDGSIRTMTVHTGLLVAVPSIFAVSIAGPWLLTPPLWKHWTRRRRHKRNLCVDCGYPLPTPRVAAP